MADYDQEGDYYGGEGGEYYEDGTPYEAEHQGYQPPDGAIIDSEGRLLMGEKEDDEWEPEVYETFVSEWTSPWLCSEADGAASSMYAWPDIADNVILKRIDVFELEYPQCQQATSDREESRRVRCTPNWSPVFSCFFLNVQTEFTRELLVESTGPPRRHKFIMKGKKNSRDTSSWVYRETLNGYIGADRIPGCQDYSIDFQDSPDRYFMSAELTPALGLRRLYRFGAYPVTQYFILEKIVVHDALESEGGSGRSQIIEKGPFLFVKKG